MSTQKRTGEKKRGGSRRKTACRPKALAKAFIWHLEAPYNEQRSELYFDGQHWWNHKPDDVSREAATYELLRRHPDVDAIHRSQRVLRDDDPDQLQWFLQCLGLKSWSGLKPHERDWFVSILRERYPGKGRDDTPGVFSITAQSCDLRSGINPNAVLCLDEKVRGQSRTEAEEYRLNEILRLAGEHHRDGRLLIAIDLHFGQFDAAMKLLEQCYRQHWRQPEKIGRSRYDNWLPVIAQFETAESKLTTKIKRASDVFRRYRSIFQDVRI